jgi:hypothetical protein
VGALAGKGLEGDRHVAGTGTFPSGRPGSALTLVAAEVCESFAPPLQADEHRRNVVVRGLELNRLVGHEFQIGSVRCRSVTPFVRLAPPASASVHESGRSSAARQLAWVPQKAVRVSRSLPNVSRRGLPPKE